MNLYSSKLAISLVCLLCIHTMNCTNSSHESSIEINGDDIIYIYEQPMTLHEIIESIISKNNPELMLFIQKIRAVVNRYKTIKN